jgi:hypothetical protein
MVRVKTLKEILNTHEWEYDSDTGRFYFPKLNFKVEADTITVLAGKTTDNKHLDDWPKSFFLLEKDPQIYKVKLKDVHLALMMTDYKFVPEGLILLINNKEYLYPSCLLPVFGNYIEVRKNLNGCLEEIQTKTTIHPLLIEGVASSRKELLDAIHALFAPV